MTRITVPADIAGVKRALADLNGLVTAKEWERAAIVAAFVVKGLGNGVTGQEPGKNTGPWSATTFAGFGIAGLRTHNSVVRYLDAWESTGKPRPKPGTSVVLPTVDWPPNSKTDDTTPGAQKVRDIANNTKAMAEAIRTNPKVAEAAKEAIEGAGGHVLLPAAFQEVKRNAREHEARDVHTRTTSQGELDYLLIKARTLIQEINGHVGRVEALTALREDIDLLLAAEDAAVLTPEMFVDGSS